MEIYKVKEGKGKYNVNNIILEKATNEQLRHFYLLGHPYIEMEKKATKKPKKTDDK